MKKFTLLLLVTTLILGSLSASCRPAEAPPTEATATAEEHFNRGVTLYEQGRLDKAIGEFTKAIELDPNYAEAYRSRGFAYSKKGKDHWAYADITKKPVDYANAKAIYQRAIADYTKAIKLDPNDAMAYLSRGEAFFMQGKSDWAIDDYTKAIELDPNDARAYMFRSAVYAVRWETDKAIADLEKAIEVSRNPSLTQLAEQMLWALRLRP